MLARPTLRLIKWKPKPGYQVLVTDSVRANMRILSVAIAILFAASIIVHLFGAHNYHYRLTLTIRDHGTLHTASNVVRVSEMATTRGAISRPRLCGEATVVDLGKGRLLIAGLDHSRAPFNADGQWHWMLSPTGVLLHRLGLQTNWIKDDSGIRKLRELNTTITLTPDELPDLITFDDPNEPGTVRLVDPKYFSRDIGDGIELVSATLQPTQDDITRGIVEKKLPWLNTHDEFLDGSRRGRDVNYFKPSEFKRCAWLSANAYLVPYVL